MRAQDLPGSRGAPPGEEGMSSSRADQLSRLGGWRKARVQALSMCSGLPIQADPTSGFP